MLGIAPIPPAGRGPWAVRPPPFCTWCVYFEADTAVQTGNTTERNFQCISEMRFSLADQTQTFRKHDIDPMWTAPARTREALGPAQPLRGAPLAPNQQTSHAGYWLRTKDKNRIQSYSKKWEST